MQILSRVVLCTTISFLMLSWSACGPTPTPTPTPVPPWVNEAESYAELAEEIVAESLSDMKFALEVFGDPHQRQHEQVRSARARASIAYSKKDGFENELRMARRSLKAPSAVEERALEVGNATSEVLLQSLDSLELTLGWAEFSADLQGEDSDLKAFVEGGEERRNANMAPILQAFEQTIINFNQSVEEALINSE